MKKLISLISALLILSLPIFVCANENSSVAAPNIAVTATSTGSATFTLKTLTTGATIYYTTNGNDPTTSSSKFTSSVKVTKTCEVRAVAYIDGEYSDVAYYLVTVAQPQVATPVLKSTNVEAGKKITITCTGATYIYYTLDGTTPSATNGIRYTTAGVTVSESCTIKAVGVRSGYLNSRVKTGFVDITPVGKPTVKASQTASGTKITITGPYSSGCTYYYTTDGSAPTPKATTTCKKYASTGVTLTKACTLKVIACKSGYAPSEIYSYSISGAQCAAVTAAKTNIIDGVKVTLKSETTGAVIYYTTDGTTPTTSSTKYTSSGITLTGKGTTTIIAIAVKSGYENSSPKGYSITVNKLASPKAAYVTSSSTTTTGKTVKITGPTGSTIYYTTNGKTPTTSSSKLASGGTIKITSSCTLNAIAVMSGYANSDVYTAVLSIEKEVATPTVSETKYSTYNRVTLKCATSGATLYYTTDGTNPLSYGSTCSSGTILTINQSCILKVAARKDGYEDSAVYIYKVVLKSGSDDIVILGLDNEPQPTSTVFFYGTGDDDTAVYDNENDIANVPLPKESSIKDLEVFDESDPQDIWVIEL